jgi:hypothetical protein
LKSKLRMAYTAYVVVLVLAFTGLLVASRFAGAAQAQALATPTSPAFCYPATPPEPGDGWTCVGGTAVMIVDTATPVPSPSPTFHMEPTSPANTPVPYPGPCDGPYPCPAEAAPLPWWHVFLSWIVG